MKFDHLWYLNENGESKTHHDRNCPHCRDNWRLGCSLPFRKTIRKIKDRPMFYKNSDWLRNI